MIGGLAAVHQFCRIGKMAIVGGCSKVVQDVPPFMLADGNPAETRTVNKIGLERNGVAGGSQAALEAGLSSALSRGIDHLDALIRMEAEVRPCGNSAPDCLYRASETAASAGKLVELF